MDSLVKRVQSVLGYYQMSEREMAEIQSIFADVRELVEALRDMRRIAAAASIGVSGNQKRIARADAILEKVGGK